MLKDKKKASDGNNRMKPYRTVIYTVLFSGLIIFSAVLQSNCLTFFGSVPALTLAFVCAIGFICGEGAGAVSGLLTGILVDALGSSGFSLSPIVYVLCGYLCGVIIDKFLAKNLPSFILIAAGAGFLREIFTFVFYGLFSSSFNLWQILVKTVLPEYLAYLVCIIPAYGIIYAIFNLFKGKDVREKRKL